MGRKINILPLTTITTTTHTIATTHYVSLWVNMTVHNKNLPSSDIKSDILNDYKINLR